MIGAAIGIVIALKIKMTAIPQMVAAFNGFGGAASALISASEFYKSINGFENSFLLLAIFFSVIVGSITFTGSFIAFGKLQGIISGKPIQFKGQKFLNGILAFAVISSIAYSFLYSYPNIDVASSNFIIKFIFRNSCCINWICYWKSRTHY